MMSINIRTKKNKNTFKSKEKSTVVLFQKVWVEKMKHEQMIK
jgi:hypothetical protein